MSSNANNNKRIMHKNIGNMLFFKVFLLYSKGKLILTSFSFYQNGETPFMLAVEGGHEECSRVLLEGGSDVNIPNKVCNLGCDQPYSGRMTSNILWNAGP